MTNKEIILTVNQLDMYFPIRKGIFIQKQVGAVQAVNNVSFNLYRGETLGLVGESGSGKSTLARCVINLLTPTGGEIMFIGKNMTALRGNELRKQRQRLQMIFQDPFSSMNPRMKVEEIIQEPLIIHKACLRKDLNDRVGRLLELVGLDSSFSSRFPHELSGGQRQRIGIARALALNPDLLICDEPVSSLDVSIQAQIVNLLKDLQKEYHLTYLFIGHDLSMIKYVSDRVAVMYLGEIKELSTRNELYLTPLHPYTQALLSAVSIPDPIKESKRDGTILQGEIPSPINPPSGCRFRTRCPLVKSICIEKIPELREVSMGHFVACHLV